jgi:hypothetical protein
MLIWLASPNATWRGCAPSVRFHVKHTIGHIPAIRDYLEQMAMKPWMYAPGDGRCVLQDIREHQLDYVKPSATE